MGDHMSIDQCVSLLSAADAGDLPRLIRRFRSDPRKGVAAAVAVASRRLARVRIEDARLLALYDMQVALHEQGLAIIAGVDEVGRGALAGPLTAAAVVLPVDAVIPGLNDSKLLLPEKRQRVAALVREAADAWAIANVEPAEIDHFGMGQANRLALRRAIDALGVTIDHALVDGIDGRIGVPCSTVIGGDAKVACIAAASVIAKVARDGLMVRLGREHPGYGLEHNKGYSTAEHLAAVRELGPSAIHRRSFAPCDDAPKLF